MEKITWSSKYSHTRYGALFGPTGISEVTVMCGDKIIAKRHMGPSDEISLPMLMGCTRKKIEEEINDRFCEHPWSGD